ncbi:hypothetical protein SBA1_1760001 [Candidatus Sulfotelmatobacter kueseliae]|uniref:Uncharacterized protein n=1 Tax=Candidatus Sulfotelmatobacter kueseliae TaxID=2042962 RepID=A0A2U3KC53_9BACT|nr:hypothetical protein SBA1_1760001 [Candidatus Sulfotelmatobacter kueseliae]
MAAMASVNLRNAYPACFRCLAESTLAKNEQILPFPPSFPHTSFDTLGTLVTFFAHLRNWVSSGFASPDDVRTRSRMHLRSRLLIIRLLQQPPIGCG